MANYTSNCKAPALPQDPISRNTIFTTSGREISMEEDGETTLLVKNGNGMPSVFLKMVIIVEFVVVLYAMSKTMLSIAATQFLKYITSKENNALMNISWNISVCAANKSDPLYLLDENIQKETSRRSLELSLAYNVPSVIMSLILGAYSDQVGRKFLFLLPMCGCFVQCAAYAIVSYLEGSYAYLFISEFLSGMCGGWVTFLIACFALTSDLTTDGNSRSFHITVLECIGSLCIGLATFGLGYMIKDLGFTISFVVAAGLTVIAAAFIVFFIKDTIRSTFASRSVKPKFRQMFHDVFRVYFSNSDGTRSIFQLCLAAITLTMLTYLMFQSVVTIFLLGRPLCMDSVDVGDFMGTFGIVPAFVTIVFVKICQKCMSDVTIATTGAISFLAFLIIVGISRTKAQIYVAVAVGSIGLTTTAMMRVTMSKLVAPGQHGALFASTASVEAIITTMASTIGNGIYTATVSVYTGTVFFVAASLNIVTVVILLMLGFTMRRKLQQGERTEAATS